MTIVRDITATLLVAVIVLFYFIALSGATVWFIGDPRGVAAVGLVLGLGACIAGGRPATDPTTKKPAMNGVLGALAGLTTIAAIVTLITNAWLALGIFVALLVVLWFATTVRHLFNDATAHTGPAHA